jgi:DNA-binding protein HU-beta
MIDAIAGKSGTTKTDSEKVLKAFTEVVKEELGKGEKVAMVGFGTFYAVARPARTGRNPRTGDSIQIAASNVPKFKPGKALKDSLN